jgi:predicted secreted protein
LKRFFPMSPGRSVVSLVRTFALVLLAGSIGVASAQTLPEPRNVLNLSASGAVEVAQDWLTLTLGVTREGSAPASVQLQVRQALDAALELIKPMAAPAAMEVRSGALSLQPRYGRDGKITGWVGSGELVLEGSDFARIGAAAGKVQTLVVSSAGFGLSREGRTRVEAQAQSLAVERFRNRASELAHAFGFSGYTLRELTVSGDAQDNPGPRPRMLAMAAPAADAPLTLEGGKTAVVVSINGAIQLK